MWSIMFLFVTLVVTLLAPADCYLLSIWEPMHVSITSDYDYQTVLFLSENEMRALRVEGFTVYFGGRNQLQRIVFGPPINVTYLSIQPSATVDYKCRTPNMLQDFCSSYIRTVLLLDKNIYLICATNAGDPRCYNYTIDKKGAFYNANGFLSGKGICSYYYHPHSPSIYADGKIFSSSTADIQGRDHLIRQGLIRPAPIRTVKSDTLVLHEPVFISSFERGDKVYFFFYEEAIETAWCDKVKYSRVARVCKNDKGSKQDPHLSTSFFKARLRCSVPGSHPFNINILDSISEMNNGSTKPYRDNESAPIIYGVFNTERNGIQASAICAYHLKDIEDTFLKSFAERDTPSHQYLPVEAPHPTPHPAICSSDSQKLPSETVNFIKRHPLMYSDVLPIGQRPLLLYIQPNARLTTIVVDFQVYTSHGLYFDVIFVGTDNGRVAKTISNNTYKTQYVVLEEIQVLNTDIAVTDLKILKSGAHEPQLLVISTSIVKSIPLQRCKRATTCRACVELKDPYCSWTTNNICARSTAGKQDVLYGEYRDKCGIQVSPFARRREYNGKQLHSRNIS